MKGKIINDWSELYEGVINNISYWSKWVSRRCCLEEEDVHQDLLIKLWEEFNKNKQKGKMTLYGMQKWIQWVSSRMLKNSYAKRKIVANVSIEQREEMGMPLCIEDESFEIKHTVKTIIEEVRNNLIKKQKHNPLKVFDLITEGLTNKEISVELGLSQKNISLIKLRHIKPLILDRGMAYGY